MPKAPASAPKKKRLVFAKVKRISYAMIMEVWVRHDSKLSADALNHLRKLIGLGHKE